MATTRTKRKAPARRKSSAKKSKGSELPLPSFTIRGFRGFKELELPKLGQVTLLAGKNSVGKSTVLEAAQLYASAGDFNTMTSILDNREDILIRSDEDRDVVDIPDHGSLFFGYDEPKVGDTIEIGCPKEGNMLKVVVSKLESKDAKDPRSVPPFLQPMFEGEDSRYLTISSSGSRGKFSVKAPFFHSERKGYIRSDEYYMSRRRMRRRYYEGRPILWDDGNRGALQIPIESLGPGLPSNAKVASLFESMELTSEGDRVLEILRLIRPEVERLASQGSREPARPRVMAKLKGIDSPIPLRSMGEGIVHLLGLAVGLISAKNGLLLIDEIENGIYYDLFPDLWKSIMRSAQKNNVQVIVATHSSDSINGFAQAASELKDIDGRLIRINRDKEKAWAVSYSKEQALTATEKGIEVR